MPDVALAPVQQLPVIDIAGDGYEAGRLYGEAARQLVHEHVEAVVDRFVKQSMDLNEIYRRAAEYRAPTAAEYPDLAAEIDGIADGANIRMEAAWMLQLRSEISRPDATDHLGECSSFAVVGEAAAHGAIITGQNADLPPMYQRLLVLLRRRSSAGPSLMTVTPAGQIGWHGMNEAGLAVFANAVRSPGWRIGVPRYILTRIALLHRTRGAAVNAIERTGRAASRNLLLADDYGATNIETAPSRVAVIEPTDGILVHTNHFIAPAMLDLETSDQQSLIDSATRLARLDGLLRVNIGGLDVPSVVMALRDRRDTPYGLSKAYGDVGGNITIASTVAEISSRRCWIAIGPPHLSAYYPYLV